MRWFDNKAVQLISNYIGIEPIDEVERWSKSIGKMITVSRPKIVKVFNSVMVLIFLICSKPSTD